MILAFILGSFLILSLACTTVLCACLYINPEEL